MTDASPEPTSLEAASAVAPALLAWSDEHGRHDLPWQIDRTPYRVWVSEIMLQQTQVSTVIPYYERFMQRFPNIEALAEASIDEVLHLWTGLGYYARARNLYRAARIVADDFGGEVPEDIERLMALPGIGRSTAGAVLALSRSQRHPILDGNARRVMARYFGIEGEPSQPETLSRLWAAADASTPADRVADYTQAIMDLGSDVCSRARPRCDACPLAAHCVARTTGRQNELPSPRRKLMRPHRQAWALIVCSEDGVLLERRPSEGLWGGLWSFPMFDSRAGAEAWLQHELRGAATPLVDIAHSDHAFTHYDLTLHRVLADVVEAFELHEGYRWHADATSGAIGLAMPVVDYLRTADRAQGAFAI